MSAEVTDDRVAGTVKWFNIEKGFGFIKGAGEGKDAIDYFVDVRAIRKYGPKELKDGEKVTFIIEQGQKGPQATEVESCD